MKRVIFHPAASTELEAAASSYDALGSSIGDAFTGELERIVAHVRRHPGTGALYGETGLRHFVVHRFPYILFYLDTADFIWIVAVAHGARKPGYWRERLLDDPQG